jgi:hypothetical protein
MKRLLLDQDETSNIVDKIAKIDEAVKPKNAADYLQHFKSRIVSGDRIMFSIVSKLKEKIVREWIKVSPDDISHESDTVSITINVPVGLAYYFSKFSLTIFDVTGQKRLLLDDVRLTVDDNSKKSERFYDSNGISCYCKLDVYGRKTIDRLLTKGIDFRDARDFWKMGQTAAFASDIRGNVSRVHIQEDNMPNVPELYDIKTFKINIKLSELAQWM